MAQVTGDSNYDWDGHYRWETALLAIRDLTNAWAMKEPVTPAEAAAVVVRILAASSYDFQSVSVQPLKIRLARVRPLEQELARLCPRASGDEVQGAANALQGLMEMVREEWVHGEGLDPRDTLNLLADALFQRGLSGKPPRKGSW
jgi:hypothetical protein